ncbi:hypothetical protein GF323_05460 [Candidatus Woesearchaeota archaeon]|nr:hypothetical protein [Candidatus Woesearchaeota archaeon]
MQLKEKLAALQKSKIFLDWKKKNKDSYLAHIFRMFDEANKGIWQFGYYNPDDTITTFVVEKEKVKEVPEQEIFRKGRHRLPPLAIGKIKLSFEESLKAAKELQEKKYPKHPIMKEIAILQKLENDQIYNITFVTQTLGTINIHLDTETGEIKSDKFTSLMDIAKFEKGGKDKKDTEYIG